MNQQPISLLLCALGGEGGGVLTEWLVETARHAGYPVQATSIPGVAQRTGATTYYLEVFPVPVAELGGQRPVLGLYPMPGRLDALVSSELLETVRQISLGHASSDRTLVLSSTARALTTMEKMQMGDGRRDAQGLLNLITTHSRAHHVLDMAELTRQAGTIVSAVMLGCIAASGLLPMGRAEYEAILKDSGGSAQASLRGFALGFDAVHAQRTQAQFIEQVLTPKAVAPAAKVPALPATVAALFPGVLHEIIALGHARLVEYQNAAYAQRYVERLQQVLAAERTSDPQGTRGWAVTREMARWLALWMAFDDIIRVADLKSRASRWSRVLGEVKAGEADLLKLYDHFKPGAPEFAALLPTGLAQRVLAWDRRRVLAGKNPWALPLKIGTHSVFGMLALRGLATLRALRPLGSRFVTEQTLIELWLGAVVSSTQRHWATGHELALCGRLIKGYGSTNERGKDNLLHVVQHLATTGHFEHDAARASAIAAARQAALADDAGKALDRALQQHGAPARPVKEQPIRWMRRRQA
ncbi:indolepyruvate oxidoreductase subunit beta family protein [Curvibacter sp. PAE-UM]|uniref:indolepyruvate oxidoreductase subunit beta family protein n=1 Tax=Curvibacter sp. PAE-UM TaxID=1714344 RepID=UPI00070B0EE8|nr:indolepyruvate oxidoreductase subunit beta family protein [Curvibacter sp. PAE-UM]KRH98664.1 indolepyruvate oxidoreductase [Curvibacter sp. PAE-UM]